MRENPRVIINKGALMAEIDESDVAPAFDLPKAGGGSGSLDDYFARPLVLFFFCKDGGGACEREAIDFSALKPEFDRIGVALVGISPDGPRSKERFRDRHSVTVDLLSDETKAAASAYGVWKEKSMYGRSYMGVERTTFLIDVGGRISKVWRKVRVAGHARDVLAAAIELRNHG